MDLSQRPGLFSLALGAGVVLVYSGALSNGFVNWDDRAFLLENWMIRSLDAEHLKAMATSFKTGNWHPLTWLSHALDYRMFGTHPAGHHFTSLLWHAFNTVLVFFLFERIVALGAPGISGKARWAGGTAAALLFALHPLRVESAVWVSERKDLLCAFFFLAACLLYLRHASRTGPSAKAYAAALGLFALALLSKPMAVSLPLVLILLDLYPLDRFRSTWPWGRVLGEKIPFLALSLVCGWVTWTAQSHTGAVVPLDQLTLGDRLLNAVRSLAFYLEKTVLPFHLSALYPFPRPLSLWTAWFWGSAAVVIGITGFCVWRWRRGERFWLVAWAAYLVMVAPVLGLLQVGRQAAADRYTYLPLLGLYFLAGGGVARFWDRTGRPGAVPLLQPVGAVLGAALLGGLVGLTVHQTAVWKNSETLWRNAVTLYPHRLPTAHLNLGKYYLRHGSLDAAEAEFQAALEIQPQRVEALNGLGQVAYRRGRWDAAESFYVSALRQGPDAIVHNNLGLVYAQLGRDREAEAQYRKALEIDPRHFRARNNLGLLYYNQGRLEDAEREYRAGLDIQSEFAGLHYNLGNLYRRRGRLNQAVWEYSLALSLQPDSPWFHNNLGETYWLAGEEDKARAEFQKALQGNPGFAPALQNLQKMSASSEG